MEWRQQARLSCTDAFNEAQRWIEGVTGKSFDCNDFRAALENGVLLCDLVNQLKPGLIRRVNRLSTPIAGLDNVSVFLKACGKLGLNESQLFHPGDLQDLSTRVTLKRGEGSRRIKNVLITIYWLGRKANQDLFYKGPQLSLKSFEGLLGLALSKAKDDLQRKRSSYKRYSSVDSVSASDAGALSTNAEGCGSDAEAEQVFKTGTSPASPRSKKGYLPPPLQKAKQARGEQGCPSPLSRPGQSLNVQERAAQVNPGWIWSKSLTDIPMVYPVCKMSEETRESSPALFKRKSSATNDTEAQWQDDFTKWKNRRRSSKSDVHRMSLEREHVINQMTNGANFQKAISETGPIKRDQPSQHSPGSHPYAASPSKTSKSNTRPYNRVPLARSYATEMPFNTLAFCGPQARTQTAPGAMPVRDVNILDEENAASLASVGAIATTPTSFPYSSLSHVETEPQNVTDGNFTSVLPKEMSGLDAATEDLSLVKQTETVAVNDQAITKACTGKQQPASVESSKRQSFDGYLSGSGTWSGSASLPRGYRRSEGMSRLSSAITARPFGAKSCRVSSLPRLSNVEDNQLNRLSGNDKAVSPPVSFLLKRQTASAHLKGHPPLKHTGLCTEQMKENCAILSNVIHTNGICPQPLVQALPQLNSGLTRVKDLNGPMREDHSDMRLCLILKPNSRHNFGFQTHWDSRGARVTAIQPGSPAELCHLCINDEIIAVDGVTVTKLNYNQWKNKMSSALQTGSLTMDVRRYGNKDWSTSEASLYKQPGQLRTTLDLTSTVPLLIGRQDHHANGDLALMALSKFNGQTNNVNICQNVDGAHSDTRRTATSKGGSESAISDLQVPSLSPSSCSWSWDREEERKRQEKWQEEQERLLQEKYQQDQERLEAVWRKAQQDASIDCKDELKVVGEENCRKVPLYVNDVTSKTVELGQARDAVKDEEVTLCDAKEMPQEKREARYESMDHLEGWRHSPVASMTFTNPRPQSAAAGYCGSTRISSSRHSTGSMPPSHRSGAWAAARISEERTPESKFGSKTEGPTVSAASPNSSTQPTCDQNTALHITDNPVNGETLALDEDRFNSF